MSMDTESVRSNSSSRRRKQKQHRKRRARRSVRFTKEEPTIHHVPSVTTLTRDEIENSWFSIDELMVIREQIEAQQRLAELGKFDLKIREFDDYVCMRGIQLETERLERKFYYNEVVKALLNEQEQQLFASIKDPEMIRTVVQFWTQKATEEALAVAKNDRLEVERLESKDPSAPAPSWSASAIFYEESRSLMEQNASIFLPSPAPATRGQVKSQDKFDLATIVGDVLSTLETDI